MPPALSLAVLDQSVSLAGSTEDAAVAARTSRIRVGSAGVMLPHYSALKVAEQLHDLAGALALDEIVINTWAHAPAVRRTSYALLAQAVGIAPEAR